MVLYAYTKGAIKPGDTAAPVESASCIPAPEFFDYDIYDYEYSTDGPLTFYLNILDYSGLTPADWVGIKQITIRPTRDNEPITTEDPKVGSDKVLSCLSLTQQSSIGGKPRWLARFDDSAPNPTNVNEAVSKTATYQIRFDNSLTNKFGVPITDSEYVIRNISTHGEIRTVYGATYANGMDFVSLFNRIETSECVLLGIETIPCPAIAVGSSVLLENGKILLLDEGNFGSQIFDPLTRTFEALPSLTRIRGAAKIPAYDFANSGVLTAPLDAVDGVNKIAFAEASATTPAITQYAPTGKRHSCVLGSVIYPASTTETVAMVGSELDADWICIKNNGNTQTPIANYGALYMGGTVFLRSDNTTEFVHGSGAGIRRTWGTDGSVSTFYPFAAPANTLSLSRLKGNTNHVFIASYTATQPHRYMANTGANISLSGIPSGHASVKILPDGRLFLTPFNDTTTPFVLVNPNDSWSHEVVQNPGIRAWNSCVTPWGSVYAFPRDGSGSLGYSVLEFKFSGFHKANHSALKFFYTSAYVNHS